jgi:hypothetical protein
MNNCLFIFPVAVSIFASSSLPAVDLIDPAGLGLGKPGVIFDSEIQAKSDYDTVSGGLGLWEARLTAPIAKFGDKDGWLLGLGLNYEWTRADFGSLGGLGETDLHQLRTTLFFRYEEPDADWWLLGFASPGIASDLADLGSDSFSGNALALLGYEWSESLSLAVGVFANHSLDETIAIPALGLIWRPEGGFIAQLTPPIIAFGYEPDQDWTFALVSYPAGGGWTVEENNQRVRQIDLTLWRAALSIEKKFGPHMCLALRGGYAIGGGLELRDAQERVITDQDLDPVPFGAITLRWVF